LGERFLERYYPDTKDWSTREAAARAIAKEVGAGRGSPRGGVYMSFSHLPKNLIDNFLEGASGVHFFEKLKDGNVDIHYDALEVAPAAHYVQGGCWINERCETSHARLFAVGEVGSGGKDGADRLAGNSITFCLAMGYIAGREAAKKARWVSGSEIDTGEVQRISTKCFSILKRKNGKRPIEIKKAVKAIMSTYAYLERDEEGLKFALKKLGEIEENDLPIMAPIAKDKTFNLEWMDVLEAINMVDVAKMVCNAALMRKESNGLHQRSDYPDHDPNWLRHITIEKIGKEMKLSKEPIDLSIISPSKEV